jgi:uncharacterized protein (DUF58 family)
MRFFSGKRCFPRFTLAGVVLAGILVVLLLAAWNTGENLLYIVFSAVLGMFVLSLAAGLRVLQGLTVHRQMPHAVYRNTPFVYTMQIKNTKRFLSSFSLRLESGGDAAGYLLRIPPASTVSFSAQHVLPRRGVYTLPPLEVKSAFPFGFIQYRKAFADPHEILVYPRVVLARTGGVEQSMHTAGPPRLIRGEGDEFFTIREYLPGDDMRTIAWRVTARMGKLMVKETGAGHSRTLVFLLDTRWRGQEGADEPFEEMIEVAASLMITLLGRQYSVGFLTPDMKVPPGRGSGQQQRILDGLARITASREPAWRDYDQEVRKLLSEPLRVFLISMNEDLNFSGALHQNVTALNLAEVVYG